MFFDPFNEGETCPCCTKSFVSAMPKKSIGTHVACAPATLVSRLGRHTMAPQESNVWPNIKL